MGAAECIALALKEECDDLVSTTSGSLRLECDGGLIECMSQFQLFKNVVYI
jgi:hypothetical protein